MGKHVPCVIGLDFSIYISSLSYSFHQHYLIFKDEIFSGFDLGINSCLSVWLLQAEHCLCRQFHFWYISRLYLECIIFCGGNVNISFSFGLLYATSCFGNNPNCIWFYSCSTLQDLINIWHLLLLHLQDLPSIWPFFLLFFFWYLYD